MRWVQLCGSLSILWHCVSLGLEWKLTFSGPVTTAEFSKFAGILSATLSQHHLSGFEIAQLEPSHPLALETPKYSKVTAIDNHHYHQEAAGGAVLHTRSTRNMAFAHSGLWAPWFLESFFLLPVLSFPSSLLTQYFWRPFFPLQCSRLFRLCTLMSSPGLPESRGTRRDLGGKAWTWSWFSPAMAALPGMRRKRN